MTAGAHPLIQIDGRCAAGIREMFVQSNNRQIFLLPVPPAGPGFVRGIRAWGGMNLDMTATEKEIISLAVTAYADYAERIVYRGAIAVSWVTTERTTVTPMR